MLAASTLIATAVSSLQRPTDCGEDSRGEMGRPPQRCQVARCQAILLCVSTFVDTARFVVLFPCLVLLPMPIPAYVAPSRPYGSFTCHPSDYLRFITIQSQVPICRASPGGRCNTIWYKLFSKMVFMKQGRRFGLSAEQKLDVWRRWKAGQTLHEIGRAFGKEHSSIRCLVSRYGRIVPAVRRFQ